MLKAQIDIIVLGDTTKEECFDRLEKTFFKIWNLDYNDASSFGADVINFTFGEEKTIVEFLNNHRQPTVITVPTRCFYDDTFLEEYIPRRVEEINLAREKKAMGRKAFVSKSGTDTF